MNQNEAVTHASQHTRNSLSEFDSATYAVPDGWVRTISRTHFASLAWQASHNYIDDTLTSLVL